MGTIGLRLGPFLIGLCLVLLVANKFIETVEDLVVLILYLLHSFFLPELQLSVERNLASELAMYRLFIFIYITGHTLQLLYQLATHFF